MAERQFLITAELDRIFLSHKIFFFLKKKLIGEVHNGGSVVPNIGRYSADCGGFCVSAGSGGQFQFPSSYPAMPLVTNTTPVVVSVCGVRSIWQSSKTISNLSRCTHINRMPETSCKENIQMETIHE